MNRSGIRVLLILVFLVISLDLASGEVPYEQVAENFLKFRNSPKSILSIERIETNRLNPSLPKILAGYLIRPAGGGFILISPARTLTPVKAYSFTSDFDQLPPPVRQYFIDELEGLARAAELGRRLSLERTEAEESWDFLLNYNPEISPLSYTPDTYLLKTTWNQNYPYNKFTPKLDDANTLAGCVNVAVAQIMKYHRYPVSGKGVVSYEWNGEVLEAILFKKYRWEDMPERINASTPQYQADQVASLISDIGIANHTNYGVSDSPASVNVEALKRHFGYSNRIAEMTNENVEPFFSTLKSEIDAERPVLLSFPSHTTVAMGMPLTPREERST